ncbi:hypothetical protein NV379_15820 [Paenibacillus sp. N1-5-1-14]|uniref:hypothetical protein n=1 Tax=Paenibacillus radicibacter TaxID=2972488 RepID=UPI002158F3CD|nr:hypothetical protein [Paenibacillus radicibacter]MCR8644121.1 hypothetical protein [Paenibacillus radicibacter]
MNRSSKTNWRTVYGAIFAICCIVLILTSLSRQQSQTKNAEPPFPNMTPKPATKENSESASKLFDKIQQDKFHSIRINENNQYWDYEPGQQIWYSHRDATVTFSLNIPKSTTSTLEQFETIRRNIAVTTTRGEPVSFTATIDPGDQHIVISLKGAPTTDIAISFFSPSHNESKQITIYYMKPITYTIASPTVPLVEQAFAWSRENLTLPRQIQIGEKHTFHFNFSEELDRTSVNEHFQRSLTGAQWSLSWIDNRSFDLTLQYEEPSKTNFVTLGATSIRTARGFQLKSENYVLIEPTTSLKFAWYDPITRSQTGAFTASNNYNLITPSSKNNGNMLAAFDVETDMRAEKIYEIINRKGNVLQTFLYKSNQELRSPKWDSQKEDLLAFDSKLTELKLYDTTKQQFDTIWTVPKEHSQIVSFDIDPLTGAIAIIWGQLNDKNTIHMQMDLLDGVDGKIVKKFDNMGSFTCYEGPCYSYSQWLEGKKLVYHADTGLWLLDIATGQIRSLDKQLNDKNSNSYQKVVTFSGHTWHVLIQSNKGNEYWIWTSPDQEITFQTSIGITPETKIGGLYMTSNIPLFYIEGKGWYRIDPKTKSARPLPADEAPAITPNMIVGEQDGKWLISLPRAAK